MPIVTAIDIVCVEVKRYWTISPLNPTSLGECDISGYSRQIYPWHTTAAISRCSMRNWRWIKSKSTLNYLAMFLMSDLTCFLWVFRLKSWYMEVGRIIYSHNNESNSNFKANLSDFIGGGDDFVLNFSLSTHPRSFNSPNAIAAIRLPWLTSLPWIESMTLWLFSLKPEHEWWCFGAQCCWWSRSFVAVLSFEWELMSVKSMMSSPVID